MTTSIPLHGEALSIIAQITVFVKVARRIFTPVLADFPRPADFHVRLRGFYGSARRIFMAFYGSVWIWGMSFSVA
jgi:hypothetical protein